MKVPSKIKSGFTLVELLAAMTVLTIIVLLVARLFVVSAKAVKYGSQKMAINSESRAVMDYMSRDLSRMIIDRGSEVTNSIGFLALRLQDRYNKEVRKDHLYFTGLLDEPVGTNRTLRIAHYYMKDNTLMRVQKTGNRAALVQGATTSNEWYSVLGTRQGATPVMENVWSFRIDCCNEGGVYNTNGINYDPITSSNFLYMNIVIDVLDEETMQRVEQLWDLGFDNEADEVGNVNAKRFSKRMYFNNKNGYYDAAR